MANRWLDKEEISEIKEVIEQLNKWCEKELSYEELKQLSLDLYTLHENLEFVIGQM